MCEELFGKENLAVKFSLEKNTLSQKEFVLIQEFYAWLAAQQSVQRTADGACENCGNNCWKLVCETCGAE